MEYIKKEDLIIGEVYTHENGNICKCDQNSSTMMYGKYINIVHNTFKKPPENPGNFSIDKMRLATPEEKHWLNTCIEKDEFITFEEAMKTFIPEYVECIEKWSGLTIGKIYTFPNPIDDIGVQRTHISNWKEWINFFKPSTKEAYDAQFVVKEPEPLPQFKVIETIETITKVENNEGDQFFIGDKITIISGSLPYTIKGFKCYENNMVVLIDNNELDINNIEHYIEPKEKVKPEFVLPENWCVKVTNENRDLINKLRKKKSLHFKNPIVYAYMTSSDFAGNLYIYGTEITFDQFKKYVLKEEVKEETLLEKAKRLYPIGTKVSNTNLGKNCIFTITSDNFYESNGDILVKWLNNGLYTVYCDNEWATIIE